MRIDCQAPLRRLVGLAVLVSCRSPTFFVCISKTDPNVNARSTDIFKSRIKSFTLEQKKKEFRFSAAAAAKSLQSRVVLCATPETAAHQAPPSLGFSRQGYWSGLPFPSPMHEGEKWKVNVKSLSHVRLLATPWTAAYQAPPSMGCSSTMLNFPEKLTSWISQTSQIYHFPNKDCCLKRPRIQLRTHSHSHFTKLYI